MENLDTFIKLVELADKFSANGLVALALVAVILAMLVLLKRKEK
ncbi:MAG: hypothetical protein P8X74_12655 [Reinekea sp.]